MGDCFNLSDDPEDPTPALVVPCSEFHLGEVFFNGVVQPIPDNPADAASPAYEAYVGSPAGDDVAVKGSQLSMHMSDGEWTSVTYLFWVETNGTGSILDS